MLVDIVRDSTARVDQIEDQLLASRLLVRLQRLLAPEPINIIAGLLGMNAGGVPLAQHAHGFWIVVGIDATFTVGAGWVAFRKRGDA